MSADVVINRLRGKLQNMPGARMFLVAQQDIRIGGRSSQGSYDYTLMSGDLQLLRTWMPKVQRAMAEVPRSPTSTPTSRTRAPDQPGDRPRGRHPARRQHEHHLHRAQQFLQPAPGIGDVRPAQPISRGDGRGPALRAGYRVAQAGGSDHRHRRARAHVGLRPLRGCQCAVERAAPGLFVADTVSFSLAPGVSARPRRPSTRRWRASGCRRTRSRRASRAPPPPCSRRWRSSPG